MGDLRANIVTSDASARMAEERARTLDGFNHTTDRINRSESGSPFHGFPDPQAHPGAATTPHRQGYRIPRLADTDHVRQQEEQQRGEYPPCFQQGGDYTSAFPPYDGSHPQPTRSNPPHNSFNQRSSGSDPDPGFRPPQAHAGFAGAAPLAALRAWFPLLTAMPDAMLIGTDLPTLMTLHNSLKPDPRQGASDPMDMWAAMAAKYSSSLSKPDEEPGVAMAKTLASLRENPTSVAAGLDDRSQVLHPARFLGGAACPAKKLWREAREAMPLEGYPPLANYDLTSIGLGGCVTTRGFKEIHNPGSPHLTLKLFSSSNMGSSTAATKRLTLADNDSSISIGDSMREVSDLNELRLAVRAMCRAAQLILPWNMSFNAIDGFLQSSNYAYADLNGRSNRAQILTDFINYVLGLNAAAWVQKDDFLTSGEIKTIWSEWFGSRPASLLAVAAMERTNDGTRFSGGGGSQGASGYGGSSFRGGRGRGRGMNRSNNQIGHQNTPNAGNFTTPPPTINQAGQSPQQQQICRRFNYGNCPNSAATCALPSGTKLHHKCDAVKANGNVCNGGHPRIQHR